MFNFDDFFGFCEHFQKMEALWRCAGIYKIIKILHVLHPIFLHVRKQLLSTSNNM